MRLLSLCAFIVLNGPSLSSGDEPVPPATALGVEASEVAWSAAFLRHDAPAISKLLADDFVGIDGRGMISDKPAELQEAKAPRPGSSGPILVREDLSDVLVRAYGNTAVLTAINTAQFAEDGKESTIRYRRTTVWVRQDGRWQCVSFHGSRILERRP